MSTDTRPTISLCMLSRPFLSRPRLWRILAPQPGQRVLEVGPGRGYYALHTARWLPPDGTLDILDIRQEMLDRTIRRAREGGITNVVPTLGDVRELPYPDNPSSPRSWWSSSERFPMGDTPSKNFAGSSSRTAC